MNDIDNKNKVKNKISRKKFEKIRISVFIFIILYSIIYLTGSMILHTNIVEYASLIPFVIAIILLIYLIKNRQYISK